MLWMRLILLPLMVAGVLTEPMSAQSTKAKASSKKGQPLSVADSAYNALQKQSAKFFELWEWLWKRSQSTQWRTPDGKAYGPPVSQNSIVRRQYQHCHAPEFVSVAEHGVKFAGEYAAIRGLSAFSICPTWVLSQTDEYIKGQSADESDSTDAAIGQSLVDSVRHARARLLQSFDRGQVLLPSNTAINGQRVRLLLDQSMRDSAMAVARTCTGDVVFCWLVQGYVEAQRSNLRQASALFDSATAHMTAPERCGWRDITWLLPDSVRTTYSQLSCTPRQQLVAQYWWLATPMFSDSLNERRVEQDVRAVRVLLLSGLPRDGRFMYWRTNHTPDALYKLIARYGWPTYLGWGGELLDKSHDGFLQNFHTALQPPYTTYEYSKGRIHSAPSLSSLYWPLSISDSSWDLNAKDDIKRVADWWPDEHMRRARPLLMLPAYQIAMLRRENDIVLASAHDLRKQPFATLMANGIATLIATPSPDTIVTLQSKRLNNESTVRLSGHIPSARTLFAMEVRDPAPLGLDARTRIGIEPPATLSAMKRSDIALSDPIVLQLGKDDTAPLEPNEALLARMLGSTTISLAENPRVGVYFESYGVRAGDTVSVSVTLRGRESVSILRRLGMAINVAGDPNASVTISWSEPNPAHITRTTGGAVPIQSRALSLEISALTPGAYDLVTGIKRGAQPEVTSTRRVTVVK